jgi:hypothetical protein
VVDILKSSQAAIDLIVTCEVSSERTYMERYQHPEWPGGMSGVTVGIGYDCGYSTADVIAADWGDKLPAAMVHALEHVAGIKGSAAHSHAHELFGIVKIPFDAAMAVFIQRDMPKWERVVSHALPNTDKLSGDSFGSLTSLAYNRGASFSLPGDRYTEMRGIRYLMGAEQFERIPDEIREMKRLWPKSPGLQIRRDKEAALFEAGLHATVTS